MEELDIDQGLRENIAYKHVVLSDYLQALLAPLAEKCVTAWHSEDLLDLTLKIALDSLGQCKLLYAVNCDGEQISANISRRQVDGGKRGQDLSTRPYIKDLVRNNAFTLSPVYVDLNDHCPCVTGIYKITDKNGDTLGCVVADYDLDALPELVNTDGDTDILELKERRQIKGDPAIRQNLFYQERVTSLMDIHLAEVNDIVTDLIVKRGIFHTKLHYSSSRATLWEYDDPHRYHLHVLEEIVDPSVCLAYPRRAYPDDAIVEKSQVSQVFEQFHRLRDADNNIYLRSASLNIINGLVGLTFSCDGSHYMQVTEFLSKGENFWFGQPNS